MDVSDVSNVIRERSRRSGEGNEEMQQTRTQPRIRSEAEEACELHDRTGNEEQKNEEDGEEEEQEEGIDEDVNGKAIYFRYLWTRVVGMDMVRAVENRVESVVVTTTIITCA